MAELYAGETATESDLLATVIEMAHVLGWRVHHTYDSRINPRAPRRFGRERYTDPGFPDLVLCRPPRLLFVELKREDGRLRAGQVDWLDALEDCGAQVMVVRPGDLDELEKMLREER